MDEERHERTWRLGIPARHPTSYARAESWLLFVIACFPACGEALDDDSNE
jgi:hypothetical protein